LCGMLNALDCDEDVENYPRVMYETERETEPELEQRQQNESPRERGQALVQGEDQVMGVETEQLEHGNTGQDPKEGGSRREGHIQVHQDQGASPSARRGGQAELRQPITTAEQGEADGRQYPQEPGRRRTHPDAPDFGGWGMTDSLTIQQCARMPMGT